MPYTAAHSPRHARSERHSASDAERSAVPGRARSVHHFAGNLAIQRAIGVSIQPQLTVGSRGDPYEREADDVASRVMSMPGGRGGTVSTGGAHSVLQRKCTACDEEEDVCVHCKDGRGSGGNTVTASSLGRLQGRGGSLPDGARRFFETRMNQDFSGVRIHHDDRAAAMAERIDARAFTHGRHIVFARGQYDPDGTDGRYLLAHELTHVMQQTGDRVPPAIQRQEADTGGGSRGPSGSQRIQDAVADGDYAEAFTILNGQSMPMMLKILAGGIAVTLHAHRQEARGVNLPRIDVASTAVTFGAVCRSSPGWVALPEDQKRAVYLYLNVDPDAMLEVDRDREKLLVRVSDAGMFVVRMADVRDREQPQSCPPAEPLSKGGVAGPPDRQVVETLFAALGAESGEISTVGPGDGLYLPARVKLMEQEGLSLAEARAFVIESLGIEVPESDEPGAGWNETDQEPQGVPGFVPPGMPPWLWQGILCHRTIGGTYAGANPGTVLDTSFIEVVRLLGKLSALVGQGEPPPALAACYMGRPDIFDMPKQQIYEIKSMETGVGAAVGEALAYKTCFDSAHLPGINVTLGSPANPGTSGFAMSRGGGGWCVWTCPAPGAIVYEHILPMENPRAAQQRLEAEARGAPQVGVETMTAVALLGGLMIGEIMTAATFAELIAALRALGQLARTGPAPASPSPVTVPVTP